MLERLHWLVNGTLKRLGLRSLKEWAWNREFSSGRWDYLAENLGGRNDLRASILEYLRRGDILDLGCGQGATFRQLQGMYSSYTGVDLSSIAIEAARSLADELKIPTGSIEFIISDIETYVPARQYRVILFNESIYYLSPNKIPRTIRRYSRWLQHSGAILIKIHDTKKHRRTIESIEASVRIDHTIALNRSSVILVLRFPL